MLSLARGWQLPAVAVGLVILAAAALALPDLVGLPRFGSGLPVVAPVAGLLGWWCAILALTSANEPCMQIFLTARDSARWVNHARIVIVGASGLAVVAAVDTSYLSTAATAASTLLGEALIFGALVKLQLAWMPPTLHMLAAAVLGAANRSDLALWAWILDPRPSTTQMGISIVILVIGATLWNRALRHGNRLT